MSGYVLCLLLLSASSVILFSLGVFGLVKRNRPAAAAFSAAMFFALLWTVTLLLEVLASTASEKIFLGNIEFFGITALFVAWFAMTLDYLGMRRHLRAALPFCVGFIVLDMAVIWTDPLHHFFRVNPELVTTGPFPIVDNHYGPWFYFAQVPFGFGVLGYSFILLVRYVITCHSAYRSQGVFLLIGLSLPMLSSLGYVFNVSIIPNLDMTPVVFGVSGVILAWNLSRHRFLELVPIAREAVIDTMGDALLIFDTRNRLVDINKTATRLFFNSDPVAIGDLAENVFFQYPELARLLVGNEPLRREGSFPLAAGVRYFDVQLEPMWDAHRRNLRGRFLVLHDITEQKLYLEERERLLCDLQEAMEQVKTLNGLLPICSNCKKIRDDQGYWHTVENYVTSHSDAEFSHGICPGCIEKLYPDYAKMKAERSAGSH